MLETMAGFMLAEHLAGHTMTPAQGDIGYQRLMSKHRRPFETADGHMAIMPYSTKQWIRFLELVGETSLAGEAWVSNGAERSNRIDELYELIAQVAVERTNAQWLEDLGPHRCALRSGQRTLPGTCRTRNSQRRDCSAHLTIKTSVTCTT
jgi:crotonobetainyl-CoA:carnitine CoA-transferase CaiB-like acyl-CoA transferase